MKAAVLKAGVVALVACAIASQGCLVPWKKYIGLKRKYEDAVAELERKDRQLADANTRIDQLRDQLKAKDQIVKLYEDKKREAEQLAARARAQLDKLQKRLEEIARTHGPGVEVIEGGILIRDQLLFPLGSAEVSEKGKKLLADVAKKFKNTNEIIQVDGHTDDIPVKRPETLAKFGDNWGLSAMRAVAVVRLLEKNGIPGKRLYIRGFSMYRPRVPNTTPENRSRNRRVEVMFLPPETAAAPAPAAKKPPAKKKTN